MEAKFGDLVGKTLIRVAVTRENADDPRVEFAAISLSFYDAFMSADDRDEDAWRIGQHDCGLCVAHDVHGNAAMVVNLPPRNDSAKQYAKLEQLHRIFRKPDFMVLGYRESGFARDYEKSNTPMDFVARFPVSRRAFCTRPKPYRCDEFSWLCAPWNEFPGPVSGAFEMFLIDRSGRVAARFEPGTSAMDSRVLEAVSAIVGPCNS